jgi:hypothetical protein
LPITSGVTDHHGDHGVAAAAAAIDRIGGGEYIGRCDARRADTLHFGGQHVEQDLGIGGGVQVAAVLPHHHFGELARIGQVAVVRQTDSIRRIHVERLCIVRAVAAGGGVANVTQSHVAPELQHVLLLKHIAHQS